MTLEEFDVLYSIYRKEKAPATDDLIRQLETKGLLSDGALTAEGVSELDNYKVDNAIIMAAGFGARSLPLSRYIPKGLFLVKGEVLIERQIRQLREAGIDEIVVVVGYLKEKFAYLKDKFNIIIVENDDYYRYNNMSSIYAAMDYLKRSFICCSDNYFPVNVFRDHVYDSYYSCKFSKEYTDEYFVTETDGEYITEIKKGGMNGWYTIGEAFFSAKFSKRFKELMVKEYHEKNAKKLLMDDFHIRHIDELPFRLYKYDDNTVQEFDTNDDVIAFDPQFVKFRDAILKKNSEKQPELSEAFTQYDDISRYDSAVTDQHFGRLHLNENSFGPSPECLKVLSTIDSSDLYEYDMSSSDYLVEKLSDVFSVPSEDIFIHEGSAEIIKSVFALIAERNDNILLPYPGWSYYESLAKKKFCNIYYYDILSDDYTYYMDVRDLLTKAERLKPKMIVINSPHNPTGFKSDMNSIEMIVKNNPESVVLLDEAYWGFSEESTNVRRLVESYSNVIITRSFSKYYALASMRIGFGFCNSNVKKVFGLDLPLFKGNPISRKMAHAALCDSEYYIETAKRIGEIRSWFTDEINKIDGVRAYSSEANFVAVKFDKPIIYYVKEQLLRFGILVRFFELKKDYLMRITLSDSNVMEKVLKVIKNVSLEDNNA